MASQLGTIQAIFLYEFNMGREIVPSINQALDHVTFNERQTEKK